MNALNLRVSSVKTGENIKKNAEVRTAIITLPKIYENSDEAHCIEFRHATTIQAQVSAIKKVFEKLESDNKQLQFLTDLYFHSPLKHPVRNQILKLLITAAQLGTADITGDLIVTALSQSIKNLLEEVKDEKECELWNTAVASMSGCFENFKCGVKALRYQLNNFFPFMCQALQKYLNDLREVNSPSIRNEFYLYIHNVIRFLLSTVQEFSVEVEKSHLDKLRELSTICHIIINNDDIPMDPRTNAGILIACSAKMFGEYDEFIDKVKNTNSANDIALLVGVINTIDSADFQRHATHVLQICSKMDELTNKHCNVPNILLCGTRALYQVSKVVLNLDLSGSPAADGAKLILRKLMIFAFSYLEHHMDSVRHLCRDMLRNIVAAAKVMQFDLVLRKIFDACNSDRLSLSMKCIVLQQAAQVLGAKAIVSQCSIFNGIFVFYLGKISIVNNLFEVLLMASHKEQPVDVWYKEWVEYLLNMTTNKNMSDRVAELETLIVKAVRCEPSIINKIVEHEDNKIPITTKLSALWSVRKSGFKSVNFNEIMQKFSQPLLLSILSNSDETRLIALRLLVETHKTTEDLTPLECQHLLTYLEYSTNCQSPATRSKSLALLLKSMMRLEGNIIRVIRLEREALAKQQEVEEPRQLIFLRDFIAILGRSLFTTGNFSRRYISLQLLERCVRICLDCNLPFRNYIKHDIKYYLHRHISDSFEANKEMAVNILKILDPNPPPQNDYYNMTIDEMATLLLSMRPADSVTAAYLLEYYCHYAKAENFGASLEETQYEPVVYAALCWLLGLLRKGLILARNSLLRAAKYNPLYGLLFAIKHLLKDLKYAEMAKEALWREFIRQLLLISKQLTDVVSPIVNNSSPEGHLPNDFGDLPDMLMCENETEKTAYKILNTPPGTLDLENIKTTPQMVLLCAWRTVKEVSLLLGDIVLNAPIKSDRTPQQYLLTIPQILDMGEHFKLLLSETKHRGAIEQAYVGFSKLCCCLWRVDIEELNVLPMLWLKELMSVISSDSVMNEKLSTTRRSAGLPFMVQALICSELQVGTTKALHVCMSQLFEICENKEHKYSTESCTHALNILRALFRCTDLSEAVGEFVSQGIMCAIRGYDGLTWSEKNSATLLFAVLITRVFGVQLTKDSDNLNIRNKMTGYIFFMRYPQLYDYFLEELKTASKQVLEQQKAHKLHPLLLILSRLYPSSLEGTECAIRLPDFIPYIMDCAGCQELQTRNLAAKAITALVQKDKISWMILKLSAEVILASEEPYKLNLNMVHGKLLQILMLFKAMDVPKQQIVQDVSLTLVVLVSQTGCRNAVIMKTMLDIFIEILKDIQVLNFPPETRKTLIYLSTQGELHSPGHSSSFVMMRKSYVIYNLHVSRLTQPSVAMADYLSALPIEDHIVDLENTECHLNVILLILLRYHKRGDELSEFETTTAEFDFANSLTSETVNRVVKELNIDNSFYSMLKLILRIPIYYPECAIKAYAIISMLQQFDFTFTQLLKATKSKTADVKSAITMCIERVIIKDGLDFKSAEKCLEYLLDISQPSQPVHLRMRAAKILLHIVPKYPKAIEKRTLSFIRSYITIMLMLIMDDDFDVRDFTAKIVLNSIPDNYGMTSTVSTMARRLFLQYTADLLLTTHAEEYFIMVIYKTIYDAMQNYAPAVDDKAVLIGCVPFKLHLATEVFEKNDPNDFAEPGKVINDARVIFRHTFKQGTVGLFVDIYSKYRTETTINYVPTGEFWYTDI